MPEVCTINDRITGVCNHGEECCPHAVSGYFIEGSETVLAGGRGVVRDGDRCWTTCPHCHTGYAVGRSAKLFADGRPVHRQGDPVKLPGGTGVSVSASSNIEDNS